MAEKLTHSPTTSEDEQIVVYNFVESELSPLNEVFNLLFERLEKEQSTD
ncbi:MAG TPA: hypothetical protein VD735_07115 [Candidatus Saccharimonadales bacterium]|nr:hypothetical protein [Candidatus Saccharimonadales bacterium]